MSLSKYYKSSNSFQPEKLIKQDEKTPSGWQSLPQTERLPFQTEPLPIATAPKKSRRMAEDEHPVSLPDAPVLPQEIDLNNYLERTIAEQKIEEAYQKGVQAGTQAGIEEGQDKAEQDFGDAVRALINTCQQLDTIRETIIRNSSEELLEFSLKIAEKIVRSSVCEQDDTIIATIEEALQRAIRSDEFAVYIHPEDHDIVTQKSSEIIAGLTGLNNIIIKKDVSVERGGAKIESDKCAIDATIASQFDVIREEIKKNL
jgi:flagellar assembly protein FliH